MFKAPREYRHDRIRLQLFVLFFAVCFLGAAGRVQAQISSASISSNRALSPSKPLTFWPRMTAEEQHSLLDGATVGAIAGAFISAYPAMSEGAGGNLGSYASE